MNKNLEELKNVYIKYNEMFRKLDFEHVMYFTEDMTDEEADAECDRASEVGKQINILEEEYMKWKTENDLVEQCMEWGYELFGYCPWRDEKHEYKDWCTDKDVFRSMVESVKASDETRVLDCIRRMREVVDEDDCDFEEFISYVEYINEILRDDEKEDEGCELVLSVDILENNGLWIPYKEGFEDCIRKVAELIGVEY